MFTMFSGFGGDTMATPTSQPTPIFVNVMSTTLFCLRNFRAVSTEVQREFNAILTPKCTTVVLLATFPPI